MAENKIYVTDKQTIKMKCDAIIDSIGAEWAELISLMNSVVDTVVEAWIADDTTAREKFVNPMLSSISGLKDQILPHVQTFAENMNDFMDTVEEISNDAS